MHLEEGDRKFVGVFPWVEPVSCAMQQIVGEWNINSSPKNENKILP